MARRRGVLAAYVQIQREAENERQRRERAAQRARREAQRAAAARTRAQMQDQRQRERLYAAERAQEAADNTFELDQQVRALESILAATLGVDDFLDLEALTRPPRESVFDEGRVGPVPAPPRLESFLPAAPSGLGRVFGGSRHAEEVSRAHLAFDQAVTRHTHEVRQRADRVEVARRRHEAEVDRIRRDHQQHVEQVRALQRGLGEAQPAAVIRYLDLVLEAADYPDDFPHTWTLSFSAHSRVLEVDYELPSVEVVPPVRSYRYVKSTDAITETARPATQVRALYASVIAQTGLRVVHELLEADRAGLVDAVVLNCHVSTDDAATGRATRVCLLALATSRRKFLDVDLAKVDPAACLSHLEARLSRDPAKLAPVEPVKLHGTLHGARAGAIDSGESTRGPSGATGGAVVLAAGQNVPVEHAPLGISLDSRNGDLAILLADSLGKVAHDEDFIFFNKLSSDDGTVVLHGGENPRSATVDLPVIDPRHHRLVIVAASDSGQNLEVSSLRILTSTGAELLFRPPRQPVTALVCGELYRKTSGWRFRALGQGWSDGLAGLARDYGVSVE